MRAADLEGESCEQRADDYEGRGEEHAAFSGEFVGGVTQDYDPDYGAYEEGVGDSCLDGEGVDFCAEDVVEDHIRGRGARQSIVNFGWV